MRNLINIDDLITNHDPYQCPGSKEFEELRYLGEELQRYMDKVVRQSEIDEFNAIQSASQILII